MNKAEFRTIVKTNEIALMDTLADSFGIFLNANDFFMYSTADGVTLAPEDFNWALPIITKYGDDGLNAVMSKIANRLPLNPYQTDEFKKALAELNNSDVKVWSEY